MKFVAIKTGLRIPDVICYENEKKRVNSSKT